MKPELETDLPEEQRERLLVERALLGERHALEALLRQHQPYVYQIALRMTADTSLAEDITQECLIKVVTHLATFQGQSRLRTWMYRIVANHVLNTKRQPRERVFSSFERHAELLDSLTVESIATDSESLLATEEVKLTCLTGMLLCLDRKYRLTFILGAIFNVSETMGSEVLGMSGAAYRKQLSRARKQLLGFMQGRCGLLDPANPCRCPHKTKAAIRAGYVDPQRLTFSTDHLARARQLAEQTYRMTRPASLARCQSLFAQLPSDHPADLGRQLEMLLQSDSLAKLLAYAE